jgi:hypothetical protein
MAERQLAAHGEARDSAPEQVVNGTAGSVADALLLLQRTAGNDAVARLMAPRGPRLQRCAAGGCTCGGACGRNPELEEEDALPTGSIALRRAVAARRTLTRQTGGPYHPPPGTSMSCSMTDDCSAISTKINYLRHTIRRHQEWDQANPDPRWPGGRHAAEIADLQRALANCIAIASTKCRGQPIYVPVPEPQENRQERAERVRQQLYEALPWAVAVIVVGLVIACVIAEPCGAAVLAAVAAVGGAEAVAAVIAILVANGIMTETEGA